jgi:GntR family transcriptional regulator, arabinose operon transcriptional repressor
LTKFGYDCFLFLNLFTKGDQRVEIPKYEQLKQAIKAQIQDGTWAPGDQLPSENSLCQQFGVSKITVKKAKDDLIAEGVLENLPGRKGAFIRAKRRTPSADFVGVAIDDLKEHPFGDMLKGIEDQLWQHGLHPILCSTYSDVAKIEAYFQALLQRDVAGVIFTPVKGVSGSQENQRILKLLAERQIPFVLIDRYIPECFVHTVISNNYYASKELINILIKKKHTRILTLAGVECSSIDERLQGYRDALQEAGLPVDPNLIIRCAEPLLQFDQKPRRDELERIRALIEKAGDFTACYPLNAVLQLPLEAIFQTDKNLGKELEIVTYDDITKELHNLTNHVALVKQPAYQMGWEAARLLIETIEKPEHPQVQMTLKAEIIETVIE